VHDCAEQWVGGQITVAAIGDVLAALPLGDTFVTQRDMSDPQAQAIQAGAAMARVGLLPW
jgi:hypothetical protein